MTSQSALLTPGTRGMRPEGLEPPRVAPPAPKAGASASSATVARLPHYSMRLTRVALAAVVALAHPLQSAVAQSTRTDLDPEALQRLLRAAEAAHSDAVVLWKDGHQVGAWRFGHARRKLQVMSITKSIVSLAIGRLVTTGRIKSLDTPVAEFYPEWRQGQKQTITLRHVLTHTSGLQDRPDAGVEVERSPDVVRLALSAELADPPGTRFMYNNKT